MPARIFVDTSFVLALINERDQYHEQAKTLSLKFEQSFLITTVAVLLEIGNALAKHFRKEANGILRLLRTSSKVEVVGIDERLFERALDIYEKHDDKSWGLVDCISFVVMGERGITDVLTFDGDFSAAGFTVVTTREGSR
jgi:predicted nucleic acid-binding protein